MGTLAALIPLLGLIAGYAISLFTKQEIKHARKLLVFVFHALVLATILIDTHARRTLNLYALSIVFTAFLIYATLMKLDSARWTTAFLGISAGSGTTLSSVSFLSLLTLGSLHKPKELILPAALYIIAVTISLLAQP